VNAAARELGRFAGEVAHQRSREPILATARAMVPAGQSIPEALKPELILTLADRIPSKGA
jgi:hypothetical protein